MKFKISYIYFIFFISLFLNGCASSPDVAGQLNAKIARDRSDIRTLEDKVASIGSNLDNLQAQVSAEREENANSLAIIQENQNTLKEALSRISYNQKVEIENTSKKLMNSSLKEFEQYNQKLEKIIKIVKQENAQIQSKVASDLQTLQNQFKAMRVQINASMDKIDRLENNLKIVTSGLKKYRTPPPVKSPSKKKPEAKKARREPVKRTGNPSSPDIDYVNVYQHTIVKGETLWKLSRDYDVPIQDIINVNEDITDATRLDIGDKLYIPSRKSR